MPTGKRPAAARKRQSSGFTYIGLLIAIAIIGVALGAAGTVSYTAQRRENERELLFVGDQFRRAIGDFYEKAPGGLKRYPQKLDELLRDNRYPSVQRWLRKVYVDPLTGKKDWGLVEVPGVGIRGVYSKSDLKPVKTTNFPAIYQSFSGAKTYSDWKFVYVPGQGGAVPNATQSQRPTSTPTSR